MGNATSIKSDAIYMADEHDETTVEDTDTGTEGEGEESTSTEETVTEESTETTEEGTEGSEDSTSKTDTEYDEDIAAEEARVRTAGRAFAQRKKKREGREDNAGEGEADETTSDEGDDDDAAPVTRGELKRAVESASAETQKTLRQREAEAIAKSLSTNPKEVKLTLLKWQNRGYPAGMSLQEQIEEAHAAATRKRTLAKVGEVVRREGTRDQRRSDTAQTQRDGASGGAPKLAEGSPLKGYTFDKAKGLYSKKLGTGKTHYVLANPGPGQRKSWFQ